MNFFINVFEGVWYKKVFVFVGFGIMVSVVYMDFGNWVMGFNGGVVFGYILFLVILLLNFVVNFF